MSRTIYKMKITSLRDLTANVRELRVSCTEDQKFNFKAGQFVMLHVPQTDSPKPALRAYSIASSQEDDSGFTLLFKYVDNGLASKYVWSLQGSETLEFTGPFGKVFFEDPPREQIIFLNTGTGLSQHLSYLLSFKNKYPHLQYRLLFGVRNESEIYYRQEMDALKSVLPNFQYEYVLSRPSESWSGKKGYVQNFIAEYDYLKIPSTFYLCGNGGMIKETMHTLETAGFEKVHIHKEAFD